MAESATNHTVLLFLLKDTALDPFPAALPGDLGPGALGLGLPRPDLAHEVEEDLVDVLARLGRGLDVGDLPCLGAVGGGLEGHLAAVCEVGLVPDQDEGDRVVALDAQDLLPELLRGLEMKKMAF